MSVQLHDHVRYRCRRRLGGRAYHDITVDPGGPVSDDRELADMLTGRWRAYHVVGSRLVEVPVEHEPWPLRNAELVACDESLLVRAGFDPRGEPPLVHFAAASTPGSGHPA